MQERTKVESWSEAVVEAERMMEGDYKDWTKVTITKITRDLSVSHHKFEVILTYPDKVEQK